MDRIFYFDNSATTKPCQEAVNAMVEAAECFGNPSSLHKLGINAENILKSARKTIAASLGCEDKNIYFTSGGTESNNIAILGTAFRKKSIGTHVITTRTEHPSVLNAFEHLASLGWTVSYLDVDKNGIISLDQLRSLMTPKTTLVSIAHVNNEIGSLQPIEQAGAIIAKASPRCSFHVDCVQSYMKIPLNLKRAQVSLASISAHKVHGFKGTGALYVANGVNVDNVNYGGGQERGLRSGTENVAGIAAFSAAVTADRQKIAKGGFEHLRSMHSILHDAIAERDNITVMCDREHSAPHIISISAKNVRGEVLLHALENKGFYVSTGSACSSHKQNISHVLKATGTSPEVASGVIRISMSFDNTEDEVRALVAELDDTISELERYSQK